MTKDPHGLPREPAWLTRLAKAKGTYSMSDFEANLIARYVRALREAAWPIVRALEQTGDETNWAIGDETDRCYPWYEIEPLKHAVLGTRLPQGLRDPGPAPDPRRVPTGPRADPVRGRRGRGPHASALR